MDETPECIDAHKSACAGAVEYRFPLSPSGRSYARCDHHWDLRLDLDDQLRQRYPVLPPSDWSPLDAGESWEDD